MLSAFVLWQLGSLAHLVLDTHVILEDGAVADLDHRTGEPIRESSSDNPTDNGCPVLNQLISANTMASQDVAGITLDHIGATVAEVQLEELVLSEAELYRISPSNSPPASS
jgi:hypothetical protein